MDEQIESHRMFYFLIILGVLVVLFLIGFFLIRNANATYCRQDYCYISPTEQPTPTEEPTATPEATPEFFNNGASHGDGLSDGQSDGKCSECFVNESGQPLLPPSTSGK